MNIIRQIFMEIFRFLVLMIELVVLSEGQLMLKYEILLLQVKLSLMA